MNNELQLPINYKLLRAVEPKNLKPIVFLTSKQHQTNFRQSRRFYKVISKIAF